MVWFWNHYSPNEADRSHPDAAPLRAESLAGLPPAYVIIAEYDPLKAEGLEYAARLEEEGVPVTVATYDDQMHAFFTMPNILDAGNASIAARRRHPPRSPRSRSGRRGGDGGPVTGPQRRS